MVTIKKRLTSISYQAKRFFEKKTDKDWQGSSNHVQKSTADSHTAQYEAAVSGNPSSIIHLVNQSFDVNLTIWSQWQFLSVKKLRRHHVRHHNIFQVFLNGFRDINLALKLSLTPSFKIT